MRSSNGFRSLIGIVARISLVLFGCIALFVGWMLNLSFNAESPGQSPLNPVGIVVFVMVLAAAAAVVLWAVVTILREKRPAEKSKNSDNT